MVQIKYNIPHCSTEYCTRSALNTVACLGMNFPPRPALTVTVQQAVATLLTPPSGRRLMSSLSAVSAVKPPTNLAPTSKVMCYPVQMAVPSPRLPAVELHTEGDATFLRFKGEALKINTTHFHKLVRASM